MIYRFDRYDLDDELFELRMDGEACALPRKSFDLLRYLLQNASRVVGKEEIFAEIWSGEHVSESVLPVNIRTIRKALGEERSEHILKTIRGRGYRITCPVESLDKRPSAPVRPSIRPRFVGREALMSSLHDDFQTTVNGEGRVVFLFGEAGIGKTRVLEELIQWSRGQAALVVHGRCPDDAGAPPFWPILQLLRAGMDALRSTPFRDELARYDFDLERARDSVLEFFDEEFTRRMDPAAARFRLTQTVVRLVSRASQIAPIVFVLDDLQCADEGTARVLEAVVRETPGMRVLAVGAYRDSDLRRGSTLAGMMGAISGQVSVRQVRLRGFDPNEIDAFVRMQTGLEPSSEWIAALHERTEGNPFFLRETLRLLTASGPDQLDRSPELARLGLPQGIREAIGRRLDMLSRDCNYVLTWASVLGRRFSFPVLEQVCGFDGTQLLRLLAEAEEAHIITSAPPTDGEARLPLGAFAFVHGLIRETIYEDISGPERVLRHRAVGEAIERLYGTSVRERVLELARHFFEAAPGGDIQRAVEYSVQAARYASSRYAYEDAVRHFDHALRAEELRLPRDDLRYCCVLLGRADALWRAGQYGAAQSGFLRAAVLARELERFDLLGHCVLGMVGWPRFNRLSFGSDDPEIERQRVRSLAKEVLTGLGHHDYSLRSRLLAVLVRTDRQGTSEDSVRLADTALQLARESGDDRSLFHALLAKQASLFLPAHLKEALDLASEAVSLAHRLRAPTRAFVAYEARIPLLLMLGDIPRADEDIAGLYEIAERKNNSAYSYASSRFALARALSDGHMERVRELLNGVLQLGRSAGDEGATWASRMIEFWMVAIQGRGEALRDSLSTLSDQRADSGSEAAMAAYFRMLAGDRTGCMNYLDRAAEGDFGSIQQDASWLWHMSTLADVCLYLRDAARAEILYELIAPYRHLNVINLLYCYRGSAAVPLASLSLVLGRREEALHLLEEGIAFNERIGARPAVVWSQVLYASVLAFGNASERRRGAELFDVASSEAAALEMTGLFERFGLKLDGRARKRLGGIG